MFSALIAVQLLLVLLKKEGSKIRYENESTDVFDAADNTMSEKEFSDNTFGFMPFFGVTVADDDDDRTMEVGVAGVEAFFPTADLRWSFLLRMAYHVQDFNLKFSVPVVLSSPPLFSSL